MAARLARRERQGGGRVDDGARPDDETQVGPFRQPARPVQQVGVQRLPEEDDIGAPETPAGGASGESLAERLGGAARSAAVAAVAPHGTVKLERQRRLGGIFSCFLERGVGVEAIDVLRHEPGLPSPQEKACQRPVSFVRPAVGEHGSAPGIPLEYGVWIARERFGRGEFLGAIALPQPAGVAERRNPRFGGNPRPRQRDHMPGFTHEPTRPPPLTLFHRLPILWPRPQPGPARRARARSAAPKDDDRTTDDERLSTRIKAEGDVWRAELADEGGERVVVFFCVSTDQRPYRVVRVDPDRYEGSDALEEIPEEELRGLFEASRSMGIPRDYPTYNQ